MIISVSFLTGLLTETYKQICTKIHKLPHKKFCFSISLMEMLPWNIYSLMNSNNEVFIVNTDITTSVSFVLSK